MLKIAHISLHIEFMSGIFRTRCDEAKAGEQIKDFKWDVFIASPNKKYSVDASVGYLPIFSFFSKLFESKSKFLFYMNRFLSLNFLLFRIIFNLQVNKLTKTYDYVIVRYNSADILAFLFLRRKSKILFYHHTKSLEELKTYNKIAYLIEKFTGKLQHHGVHGIVSVSPEIVQFECNRNNIKNTYILTNGIIIPNEEIIDNRDHEKIKIIMVCSRFQDFHGLDLLLESINVFSTSSRHNHNNCDYELHFYGEAYPETINQISLTQNCFYHGHIDSSDLCVLFSHFDLGIGVLAYFRRNITQTSAIKTKEYLASGLPIINNYTEIGFPPDFNYIKKLEKDFTFDQILDYALEMKKIDKNIIKKESAPFINEKDILLKFVNQIKT